MFPDAPADVPRSFNNPTFRPWADTRTDAEKARGRAESRAYRPLTGRDVWPERENNKKRAA